jgi:hypothetical protein
MGYTDSVRTQNGVGVRFCIHVDTAIDLEDIADSPPSKGGLSIYILANQIEGHKLFRMSDAG